MSTAPGFPPSEYVSMALWAPFSKIVGITAITNQVPKSCRTGTLSTGFRGSSFVELAPIVLSSVELHHACLMTEWSLQGLCEWRQGRESMLRYHFTTERRSAKLLAA